jgi:hypothetical protein
MRFGFLDIRITDIRIIDAVLWLIFVEVWMFLAMMCYNFIIQMMDKVQKNTFTYLFIVLKM